MLNHGLVLGESFRWKRGGAKVSLETLRGTGTVWLTHAPEGVSAPNAILCRILHI